MLNLVISQKKRKFRSHCRLGYIQIYLFRLFFIMSEEHKQKEYYERQFMLEHDRAMGYAIQPRTEQTAQHRAQLLVIEMANAAFPGPFALHKTFRTWIERNRKAHFDCFEEPNWSCLCYKCETFRAKCNKQLDLLEEYMDQYMTDAIQGPSTYDDTIDRKMTVQEADDYDQDNTSTVV